MGNIKKPVEYVYGPIKSRRLGLSLGINLSPKDRIVCNFNCIYCQYSWYREEKEFLQVLNSSYPQKEEIEKALYEKLRMGMEINSITFAGQGEPTLHFDFQNIVQIVIKLRNKYAPHIPLSIFTNASNDVDFSSFDNVFLKLDVGDETSFKEINRPKKGISYKEIIRNIKNLRIKKKIIQTIVISGEVSNMSNCRRSNYLKLLADIKPDLIQLYTLLHKSLDTRVSTASKEELNILSSAIKNRVGVQTNCYY